MMGDFDFYAKLLSCICYFSPKVVGEVSRVKIEITS
jgi:hypothetical protein